MNKKKILILGGINFSCEIVEEAHKLGYIVYVADYNVDSPAKALADYSYMTSATDVDEIAKIIHDNAIDGVIFGYADVLMSSYVDICKKADLPFYTNHQLNRLTLDKQYFKEVCKKYGIPTIPTYTVMQVDEDEVEYPILVKPIDNSGARGIFICHNKVEFYELYQKSLSFSKNKSVLIEKYCKSSEATAFYYFHKGEVYLLGFADRLMLRYDDTNLPLPVGYIFPSMSYQKLEQELLLTIPNMFKQEGFKEGFLFMQGFIENNSFVPYEIGYRFTASMEQHLFEHIYGFNHMTAILQYAVNNEDEICNIEKINPAIGHYANVTLLLNRGTITAYVGIEELKKHPNVLHTFVSYPIGTQITDLHYGKLAQAGIRVLLYANNNNELVTLMNYTKETVSVLDENGNDMIIRNYTYGEE